MGLLVICVSKRPGGGVSDRCCCAAQELLLLLQNADVLFWRPDQEQARGSNWSRPSNAVLCGNKLSPGGKER